MEFEYIRNYYQVPAEIGREIMFEGKRKGIIVADRGNYIGVNFFDSDPEEVLLLHPTWEVEYLEMGVIRKISKSKIRGKQRYQEYRQADWFSGTFAEWLGIKPKE